MILELVKNNPEEKKWYLIKSENDTHDAGIRGKKRLGEFEIIEYSYPSYVFEKLLRPADFDFNNIMPIYKFEGFGQGFKNYVSEKEEGKVTMLHGSAKDSFISLLQLNKLYIKGTLTPPERTVPYKGRGRYTGIELERLRKFDEEEREYRKLINEAIILQPGKYILYGDE